MLGIAGGATPVGGAGSGSADSGGVAGMGGGPARDPECVSAVKVEGNLQVSAPSNTALLVGEVTGDVKIDAETSDLPQLRCLETVGNDLDVHIANGDLSVLGRLRAVHINLTIHGNHDIRDLSSLSSLSSVGTALTIEDNDALVDLSGLENLDNVFELNIRNNPKLENLNALSKLALRGGDIEIAGNQALVDVTGLRRIARVKKLMIGENPLLPNLAGLDGVSDVSDVSIIANDALINLDGLLGVKSVHDLEVRDNQALSDLAGLSNLATARSIRLSNNVALTNIDALRTSLTSLDYFELTGSPKVTNVEGLGNLASIGGFYLDTSGVTTLSGFRNLRQIGDFTIGDIKIKDLTGLDRAKFTGESGYINIFSANELESLRGLSTDFGELGAVTISGNAKLRDFSEFTAAVSSIGLLSISSNPKLESLTGLENLERLGGFVLTDSVLTSLAPLDGLQSISDDADIERNPNLSNCEIQAFVERTGAATSTLMANGPCN